MRALQARRLRGALAAVAAVAVSLVMSPLQPARADSARVESDKSAWFWSSNSKVTVCTEPQLGQDGVCQAGSGTGSGGTGVSVSPISLGHVGVSLKDSNSDMRGYIHFDTASSIPFGAQITRFIAVVSVSSPENTVHTQHHQDIGERPPSTTNERAAAIQACAVTDYFTDGTEGDPPYSTKVTKTDKPPTDPNSTRTETTTNEPNTDCGLNAGGVPSADLTTWSFDITRIAKKWESLELFNEGIALMPVDRGLKPTWTLEFHGARRTKAVNSDDIEVVNAKEAAYALVEYTGGVEPPPPPPPPPPYTPFVPQPPISVFPPPVDQFTPTPSSENPTPAAGGVPVAAPVPAKGSAWMFALLPLGILALGIVSTAIGGDDLPQPAQGKSNRVASVLQRRRRAGSGET